VLEKRGVRERGDRSRDKKMASPGRSWRGRRGGYRGGRGGRGGRRGPFRGRQLDGPMPPPVELGTREIEGEGKKIVIDAKSNDQGKFIKITEHTSNKIAGKIIFSMESADRFKMCLDSFINELKSIEPLDDDTTDQSKTYKSDEFSQGRRRFVTELRQNNRGKFLKITQKSPTMKSFVAIPAEMLHQLQDMLGELLEEHGEPTSQPMNDHTSPPGSPDDHLPSSQEIRAGGKSFFFDVARNERGVYVRLSEVLRGSGRRTYINIPNSCWPEISKVFSSLHQEMPYDAGSASGSGSEDN
jgi:hypothetical protein